MYSCFRLPYGSFVGGAIAAMAEDFTKVNGFSNLYFGWGSEDDDIYERLVLDNYNQNVVILDLQLTLLNR